MPPASRTLSRDRRRLSLQLGLVLSLGFGAVAAFSTANTLSAARRQVIESTLPLTLDALSADLQEEFVRPIVVAQSMAANSLLIDWQAQGEQPRAAVQRYLGQVQAQHGTTTAFFVSERSGRYYHPSGVIKSVSPDDSQDAWYYRLLSSPYPYEVNLDRDTADLNRHTVFVNVKLRDRQGDVLGAVGVGRSTTLLTRLIRQAQDTHGIRVMFVNPEGRILFSGQPLLNNDPRLAQVPGLGPFSVRIVAQANDAFSYRENGQEIFVRSRRIPELNWVLVVSVPLQLPGGVLRQSLIQIIGVALLTLALVLVVVFQLTGRQQRQLEQLAYTDAISGALNRTAYPRLLADLAAQSGDRDAPIGFVLLAIDDVKRIQDRHGHSAGDAVIRQEAERLRSCITARDLLFRWGDQQFLLLLPGFEPEQGDALMQRLQPALANIDGSAAAAEFDLDSQALSASAGAAIWRRGADADAVLAAAARALERAKELGQYRLVVAEGSGHNSRPIG